MFDSMNQPSHPLPAEMLDKAFFKQLSILYNAKKSLIDCLPQLIEQATFINLKLGLQEEFDESKKQLLALDDIFLQLGNEASSANDLALGKLLEELQDELCYDGEDYYGSDMSILFYMNAIENLQIGAFRVVKMIADKTTYESYRQLVKESLDISKDNARLFKVIAKEYLE